MDWEWDQPQVLRESGAALRVEGSEAGRGELGSEGGDVGVDQAELLIGGIVEEGPSLTHPGPQAGDGAGDCVGGLAGPVELGLPFGPGCAGRYAGDVDFEQAAGVAAAPELREERDVVRDGLAAADIEVGHAADVFGCADGVVEVSGDDAEDGVGVLVLPEVDGEIVDRVGAEGAGFEACDGLRGQVSGVLGVVGVAIGDGLEAAVLRDQRRDEVRESGEREEQAGVQLDQDRRGLREVLQARRSDAPPVEALDGVGEESGKGPDRTNFGALDRKT